MVCHRQRVSSRAGPKWYWPAGTGRQRKAHERHSHVPVVCGRRPQPRRGGGGGGSSSHGGLAAVTWAARCSPRQAPGARKTGAVHPGPAAAASLAAAYVAAVGGSHPLARRIGAWPSVAVVTAVTVAAAEVVNRTATR